MEDEFEHALMEAGLPVSDEFAEAIRENLGFIRARYQHKERAVDSCLKALGDKPTLIQVLVAAYVLNGGVSLKYNMGDSLKDKEKESEEFEQLLKEIRELDAHPPEISDE